MSGRRSKGMNDVRAAPLKPARRLRYKDKKENKLREEEKKKRGERKERKQSGALYRLLSLPS